MPRLLLDHIDKIHELTLEDGYFAWLPAQTSLQNILYQIVTILSEMEDRSELSQEDFLIQVAREDYPIWFANQIDLVSFSRALSTYCNQPGFPTIKPPIFHLMANDALEIGSVQVKAINPPSQDGETQYLGNPAQGTKTSTQKLSIQNDLRAYLTSADDTIYQLTKPVTNIGRREDNDIVLEDQKISRQHAQIRRVHKHYMVFDLNSTGGTWVNNRSVSQATLESGDVISFAGTLLIYAEETSPGDEDQTNDLNGTTSTPTQYQSDDEPSELI